MGYPIASTLIDAHTGLSLELWGQNRVAVKCPHCNGKDVGSNPDATRNENGHWDGPLHRRCPSDPTGSKLKTSDVKLK